MTALIKVKIPSVAAEVKVAICASNTVNKLVCAQCMKQRFASMMNLTGRKAYKHRSNM